ncbi:hypothetical protein EK21DRAFT_108363 [Setomelanomma holmii]|uniref:Uncharacterized protein n=1 Tax=Setomelanomma holmii TaxID=210430 RepID=A0A9P4LNK6_9PLEO|nr:hypothetical protein EK21DRAFT_108363 [Setomelanomma holmii]
MAAKKRGGGVQKGVGSRGGGRSQSHRVYSASPAPIAYAGGPVPRLKLKLRTPAPEAQFHQNVIDFSQQATDVVEEEDDEQEEELPIAQPSQPSPPKTRGRRVRKPKKYEDYVVGSEMDHEIETSTVNKVDSSDDGAEYQMRSTPPSFDTRRQEQQNQPRKRSGARNLNHDVYSDPDPRPNLLTLRNTSSSTVTPSSPAIRQTRNDSDLNPDDNVFRIMKMLTGSSRIVIDLPDLEETPGVKKPYSAPFLMHLYLAAYAGANWNICDLIADTWIRAFHKLRKRAARERFEFWRPNKPFLARLPGEYAPQKEWASKLRTQDPLLADDVTDFHAHLLNLLYQRTAPDCGARSLWADTMALRGGKLEDAMTKDKQRKKKDGRTWHPDLVYDIMLTGLRLCRRKLTLKIEESVEGAWCQRYHEHGKHGRSCYREMAAMRDPENSDEDEVEQLIQQAMDVDMENGGDAKHVTFQEFADGEMIDVDAEGDSDDE